MKREGPRQGVGGDNKIKGQKEAHTDAEAEGTEGKESWCPGKTGPGKRREVSGGGWKRRDKTGEAE